MSRYYVAASVVLGAVFLWQAYALKYRVRHARDPQPMVLFHYSISYLALLFLAVGVDPFLRIAAS
jgi:protoheme IX farnesyltransferase